MGASPVRIEPVNLDRLESLMGPKAARQERQARLRPMGAAEVVAAAFEVCQQSAVTAFRSSIGPVIAALASIAFVIEVAVPTVLFTPRGRPVDTFAPLLAVSAAGVIAVVIAAWVYSSVLDSILPVAARHLTGEEPTRRRGTFGTALVGSLFLLGPFFIGVFLIFLSDVAFAGKTSIQASIGVYGFIVFGIGALVFLFGLQALSLAPAVARIEGTGPFRSIARALALGKRAKHASGGSMAVMAVFLSLLVFTGLMGALLVVAIFPSDALAETPLGPRGSEPVTALIGMLPFLAATLAIPPLWASCAVVTYFSRRVAVEGFDIEVVAREVGMLHEKD